MTPRLAMLALAALATGGVVAQEAPSLSNTPACRSAMDTLERQEANAAQDRSGRAALEAARRQAAVACLGGGRAPRGAAPGAAPRAAQPSFTTPAMPALPAQPATPAVPQMSLPTPRPAPRAAAPVTLTGCDGTGCWASDGTRLQRAGPNQLIGPNGICTVTGTLLQCPR